MFAVEMIAESTQLIGVLLIVAGAVGYLTIYYRRRLKGGQGGDCGSCGSGIPLRKKDRSAQADSKPAGKQFLPAEDLADLAARRREESDRKHE